MDLPTKYDCLWQLALFLCLLLATSVLFLHVTTDAQTLKYVSPTFSIVFIDDFIQMHNF